MIAMNRSPEGFEIPGRKPFTFDAWLPSEGLGRWMSARQTMVQAFGAWIEQIKSERLLDITGFVPNLALHPTDGALTLDRANYQMAEAFGITPHAASQLINVTLHKVVHPSYMPHNLAWYSPRTRSQMFGEVRTRSIRGMTPLIFRTYVNPTHNVRTVRAVVTPRHGTVAYDDTTLIMALQRELPSNSRASVTRSALATNGHVILPDTTSTGCGSIQSVIYFRNSEVSASSLGMSGGAYLSVTDTVVDFSAGAIDHEMTVLVESDRKATLRRHTAPARFGMDRKIEIAMDRITSDIRQVSDAAKELPRLWNASLTRFPAGIGDEKTYAALDLTTRTAILLDQIEETGCFKGNDRQDLKNVLLSEERLGRIPQGSAAHVAAAFAVLGREAGVAEARRFQQLAGQWIRQGWSK